VLKAGVTLQAEVALPMGSEHYRVSGTVLRRVNLPLFLKTP
jgi:hypothetical protein